MERKLNGSRHEDMSQSGLYTSEELNQWNDFLHYGHFRNSIIERITTGTCVNQQCHNGEVSHQLNYNYSQKIQHLGEDQNMDHKQWCIPVSNGTDDLHHQTGPMGKSNVPCSNTRGYGGSCDHLVCNVLWGHVQVGTNLETQ